MVSRYILISILDELLKRDQSGQFCVSWAFSPRIGFGLTVRKTDGTLLWEYAIGYQQLKGLLSRLVSDPTGEGKPST